MKLVVISPGQNLLAGGAQQEGVFVLGHIRAGHVDEGWTGVDQARVHELLHGGHVVGLLALYGTVQ